MKVFGVITIFECRISSSYVKEKKAVNMQHQDMRTAGKVLCNDKYQYLQQ
jgi:hypothetical protein